MSTYKYIVSAITLVSLSLATYNLASINYDNPEFIHSLLYGFYSAFTFIVILTYRISLIGKEKVNWAATALTVLLVVSLFLMEGNKKLVFSLWDYTLVGYILLCGAAVFQIIPDNKSLTRITKAATAILLLLLIVTILFKLGSPLIYNFTLWILAAYSILLIVNFFLNPKESN